MPKRMLTEIETGAISAFIMETALKEIPDDINKAAILSTYLRQALLPFLVNAVRIFPGTIIPRTEGTHSDLFFNVTKKAGQKIPDAAIGFQFFPEGELGEKVKNISSWLAHVVRHPDLYPWLNQINDDGKIKYLFEGGPLRRIHSRAVMGLWDIRRRESFQHADHKLSIPGFTEETDYKILDVGLKGPQWLIKMKSSPFLREEGVAMNNCLIDAGANYIEKDEEHHGNYDSMLSDPHIDLLSYRDEDGPHVDFVIRDGVLLECEGRHKHRPSRKYEGVIKQVIMTLGCDIERSIASSVRLIKQDGVYYNIYNFSEDFVVKGDLIYKFTKRPITTARGLSVEGKLAFQDCKSSITLSEGLSANHISIVRSPGLRTLGDNMTCSVLEIDFLPTVVPENVRIDTVFYGVHKTERMSGSDFIKMIQTGAARSAESAIDFVP